MLFSLSSGYRYPPFKQLGNGYLVSRLNVTNATRDLQRVPVSRVPRAPQPPRHYYATLRVSPSRAPVLSFAHYFQAPATQATLL